MDSARLKDKDLELVRAKNFGHIATLNADGSPHSTAVWIDEAEGKVRFNSTSGSAKIRHLRRDPRIAVSVHDQDNPYLAVSFRGTARLTQEGADEHIDELTRKYTDMDRFPDDWRVPGDLRIKVEVSPETILRYGY